MPKLERIELNNSPQLIVPDEILEKIKYLCRMCPLVEWSGLLFYDVEGKIEDEKTFKMTIRDVFLMSVDTKAYTAFEWDESIVDFRMSHPDLMTCVVGHIHSHNDMTVFFSPTDWSELNDNSPLFDFYLSLIINNFMDMKAKVAFVGKEIIKVKDRKFTCKSRGGIEYILPITMVKDKREELPTLFTYDCEIIKNEENLTVPVEFLQRFTDVLDRKEKEKIELAKKAKETTAKDVKLLGNGRDKNKYRGTENRRSSWPEDDWGYDYLNYNNSNSNNNSNKSENRTKNNYGYREEIIDEDDLVKMFAAFVLRLGNDVSDDTVEAALEDIDLANLNLVSVCDSIKTNYFAYYENYFDKVVGFDTFEAFNKTIRKVESALRLHREEFKELVDPIMNILITIEREGAYAS